MSIQETFEIDNRGEVVQNTVVKRFFLTLVVILVALLSFGLGRLSSQAERPGVEITFDPSLIGTSTSPTAQNQTGAVVAATKSGQVFASSQGKRYYYLGCKNTISEKNKVFFETAQMAEKAGYTLAAGCTPK